MPAGGALNAVAGAGLSRRRALGWLAASGAAASLSGCGEPTPPLSVGTIVFPGYELMFLARELGLLPPDVRLVELLSGTDNLSVLAARQVEAITLTIDEVLSARATGLDLRVVMVFDISEGADAVLARPGIGGLKGLRGRRVGVEDGAMGIVMFDAVLAAAGLGVDDVVKVPITANRGLQLYQQRAIDAVVTFEPWVSQLEQAGAVRLFDSGRVPERIVDVLAVRADALVTHAAPLRRLVHAHFEALAHFRARQEASSRLMATRLQVPPESVPDAFRGLRLPDAAENRRLLQPGGRFDASVQSIQRLLSEQRIQSGSVPLEGLVDLGFLPT